GRWRDSVIGLEVSGSDGVGPISSDNSGDVRAVAALVVEAAAVTGEVHTCPDPGSEVVCRLNTGVEHRNSNSASTGVEILPRDIGSAGTYGKRVRLLNGPVQRNVLDASQSK